MRAPLAVYNALPVPASLVLKCSLRASRTAVKCAALVGHPVACNFGPRWWQKLCVCQAAGTATVLYGPLCQFLVEHCVCQVLVHYITPWCCWSSLMIKRIAVKACSLLLITPCGIYLLHFDQAW